MKQAAVLNESENAHPQGGTDASVDPSSSIAKDTKRPRRVMGLGDLTLFYVVTGMSLRWIAAAAAAGPKGVAIWVVAWLTFFVPLALSVIELSSRYPEEGGLYVWSKRAFGDFGGFMSSWVYWANNLPYFPAALYFAAGNILFLGGVRWLHLSNSPSYFVVFSILALIFVTVLNIVGLNVAKWLNNAGAFAMWLPVLIVIVMGIIAWSRFGSATQFTFASLMPGTGLKDLIFCSTIFYALGGCESASFMGEEIKDARRNIPRAILIGGALITIAYIGGTICVLLALAPNEVSGLEGLMQAVTKTAQRIGFGPIIPMAAILIAVSNLGAVGAFLGATARLPFVAGLDRYLPAAYGRLHPRWGTPSVALLTQGIFALIFVFLGQAGTSIKGAYDVLVSLGVIWYFIPYLFVFASLLRLQHEPAAPGVVRIPGGKAIAATVAILGFVTTLTTIILSLIPPPDEPNKVLEVVKVVGLTAVLVAIGAGVYVAGKRRASKQVSCGAPT